MAAKGRKAALLAGVALVVVVAVVGWLNRAELRTWYLLWRDFESLGLNAQGYPEYRHRRTGIIFVGLPGGKFDMGSPRGEQGRHPVEGPVHNVTLSPFLIKLIGQSPRPRSQKIGGDWPVNFMLTGLKWTNLRAKLA